MMILSYPGNPVTALADESFFERVVAFARRHRILVVHDFAYSELVFDGRRAPSFLSVPGAKEVGIEFNSLSKTFNMAGCRIGYVCGHPGALAALMALKSHIDYGVFAPIQHAAIAALTADPAQLAEQVRVYEARRDALAEGLAAAGWPIEKPAATMFAWAAIPPGWRSREFAFALLEDAGVAVTPGDAFGRRGEGFVRIALVQPEERLREAARRIGAFLRSHGR
jgi:LL-diaminopimelate aminotransferase